MVPGEGGVVMEKFEIVNVGPGRSDFVVMAPGLGPFGSDKCFQGDLFACCRWVRKHFGPPEDGYPLLQEALTS